MSARTSVRVCRAKIILVGDEDYGCSNINIDRAGRGRGVLRHGDHPARLALLRQHMAKNTAV